MRWLSIKSLRVLALFSALSAPAAQSAEGYVKISSPANGARVDGFGPTAIAYEALPGPKGNHVHVYVDGKEVGILRQLKGSYTLGPLAPGPRVLCVKVVNRAHVPIGIEQCVKVTVD
ncbi:MAG: hypothetical protein FJ027_21910 [Candidatus Rokubacteria bacterium]|nr:hypothetical protein [Candidatus Rokubacteria bacterium]